MIRRVAAIAIVGVAAACIAGAVFLYEPLPSRRGVVEIEGLTAQVTVRFDPRHGPHRRRPRVRTDPSGHVCSWGATALSLRFSTGVTVACGVPTTVVVVPGRPLTSALSVAEGQAPGEVWADADDSIDFAGEHELLCPRHRGQEPRLEVRGELEARRQLGRLE